MCGAGDGSGEAGGEGEGDGEAVGEADDDVADDLAGLEVLFDVGIAGRVRMDVRVVRFVLVGVRYIMHGRSVMQRCEACLWTG